MPGFLREIEVLRRLARALPLPVPVAECRGEPDERFPAVGRLPAPARA